MALLCLQTLVLLSLVPSILAIPKPDPTPDQLCTCTDAEGLFSGDMAMLATQMVCQGMGQGYKYKSINAPNGAIFGACTGPVLTLGYEVTWGAGCTAQNAPLAAQLMAAKGGPAQSGATAQKLLIDGGGCCDTTSSDPNYCHFVDKDGKPIGHS